MPLDYAEGPADRQRLAADLARIAAEHRHHWLGRSAWIARVVVWLGWIVVPGVFWYWEFADWGRAAILLAFDAVFGVGWWRAHREAQAAAYRSARDNAE